MVQVSDAKFNEYMLSNNGGTVCITCDKQQPMIPGKKVALRDLCNESRNNITKPPPGSSLLTKGKEPDCKRQKPDCSSPLCHQFFDNSATNGHLVYVRRKAEQESGKMNICGNKGEESQEPSRRDSENHDLSGLQNQLLEPGIFHVGSWVTYSSGGPSVPCSPGKLGNESTIAEPNQMMVQSSKFSTQVNPHRARNQHWKERYVRLQNFLKKCDESSQENYIQVGLNRHAVELEKKVISLIVEEGKELRRMRVLNVLGKSAPKNTTSDTRAPSVQAVSEK